MKPRILFWVKVLISAILIGLILHKIDWLQFVVSVQHGDMLYLSFSVVGGLIFNIVKFLKWKYLINSGNHIHSFRDAAKSYMIGNALGLVTPMRAGDLGRALYFPKEDRSRIIAMTIIDRLIDLAIVFLLAVIGSYLLINKFVGFMVIVLAAGTILILFKPVLLLNILTEILPKGNLKDKLLKISAIIGKLGSMRTLVALILSLAAFLVIIVEFYFLLSAFEYVSFLPICLVTPLITLSSILPVSFMGLGVREGISITLFSSYSVSAAASLSAAFLFFIINNVSISLIGVFFLSKIRFPKEQNIKQ